MLSWLGKGLSIARNIPESIRTVSHRMDRNYSEADEDGRGRAGY